jgi:hypothetical protein
MAPSRYSLPVPSIVSGEKTSEGDFVTVVSKKRVAPSSVNIAAANTTKNPRVAMIGVRSSSSLFFRREYVGGLFLSLVFPLK